MHPGLRSRQPQVDLLRGQLNALGAGRGSVVLVTGPAGSGKTTLLAEAVSLAADSGILVFCGGGDPAARAVPLGAILDALVSTDDPPVDPARLRELSQSPDQRFWLLRELQESLEKAAQRAPLLVVVDDLQWADAATASALVTLSRRLATHRISWLLALRRGELADAAQDAVGRLEAAGASEIQLGPLDEAAVAQVARDMLGAEPDQALREVLSRADGQPFLLTELLRGLRTENLVTVDGSTAKLAAGARLPRRLVDSVAGQLARLTVPARDAVEMASVLGHSFSLDELAGLLGRPPLDLRSEIREAIAAGLLTEEGDRLGFRHDLVREAVDASLPKAVRRSMRRTAVEVMLQHGASAADVAQLVMDIAEPGDGASASLLRRAAAQIGQRSPAVAAPLSRRALDLMPRGGPGRGEAVVETIDLLVQAGRAAEAARLLTASERDLADPVAEARARLGIGMLMAQYAPAAVAEQCQAALRLPGVPPALRVQLLSLLACGLDISGEADAAAGPVADAIAEAAASGDPAAEIVTFVPRALLAFAQGDWRGAIGLAGEAARRQHEAEELRMWLPETWKSLLLISELRLEEAHAIIEAGTREAENVCRNIRVWSMLRCRAGWPPGSSPTPAPKPRRSWTCPTSWVTGASATSTSSPGTSWVTSPCAPAIPPRCRPPGGTRRHCTARAAAARPPNASARGSLPAWTAVLSTQTCSTSSRPGTCTPAARSAIATQSSWCGCCWRQGSGRTPPPSPRGWRAARTRIRAFLGCAPPRCMRARSLTTIPDGPWPLSRHTAVTLGRWSARRRLRMPGGCSCNWRRTRRSATWTRRSGCSPPRAPNETRRASAACSVTAARSVQAGARTRPRRSGRS